jgi:hypothetical protein
MKDAASRENKEKRLDPRQESELKVAFEDLEGKDLDLEADQLIP